MLHHVVRDLTLAKYICLGLGTFALVMERISIARKNRKKSLADKQAWMISYAFWEAKIQEARDGKGWVTFPAEDIPLLPDPRKIFPKMPPAPEGKYMVMYGPGVCTLIMPGIRYEPEGRDTQYYNWRWIS